MDTRDFHNSIYQMVMKQTGHCRPNSISFSVGSDYENEQAPVTQFGSESSDRLKVGLVWPLGDGLKTTT